MEKNIIKCNKRPDVLLYEGRKVLSVDILIEILEMYKGKNVVFAGESGVGFCLVDENTLLVDSPEYISTMDMDHTMFYELKEDTKEIKEINPFTF